MKKCYKMHTLSLIRCLLLQVFYFNFVSSHGRLFQPPGRSSAWRYGFSTPTNYNDHELYCGGYSTQWGTNGGKCGLCGDAYSAPKPRPNENGGTFGRGVIVQKYKRGQEIELGVELTAFHMGYFEFRLCPHNAPNLPEDEKCFDKYLLLKADGGGSRFYPGPGSKYKIKYLLPKELTCKQCVLQWRYVAGNNWGRCSNGTGMVGCGPQEEFRSCSDVQITEDDGSADETPGIVPAIASIPEDSEDYNDIKSNLQSQNVEQTQSNTDLTTAVRWIASNAVRFITAAMKQFRTIFTSYFKRS